MWPGDKVFTPWIDMMSDIQFLLGVGLNMALLNSMATPYNMGMTEAHGHKEVGNIRGKHKL